MQVWNALHAARCKYRTQKSRQKSPSWHHRPNLSGYIFAITAHIDNLKKLVKQQQLLHMPHNMVNFGSLAPEIVSLVWGTPANFNRFRVLASLLHRRCSPEANQILHDVWPSPVLVHIIYTFSGPLDPWRNFARCKIHFALKSCILLYWQHYCMALQQQASAKLCSVVQGMELQNFCTGRSSRWDRPTF